MKHLRIVLAVVGVMIVAAFSYDVYLRWQTNNLLGELRNRARLSIPRDVRIALTDGTAEGTAKGARWLEDRLRSKQGSMIAMRILNSMMAKNAESPPGSDPIIASFRVIRWRRYHDEVRSLKRRIREQDQAVDKYFRERNRAVFRPLPRVDWTSVGDIEGKALAAIETRNVGFLLVLSDGITDAGANLWIHRLERNPSVIHFDRIGDKYDVRQLTFSRGRLAPYQVSSLPPELEGRTYWATYQVMDADRDGLPGIAVLTLDSHMGTEKHVPTTQPTAPHWEEALPSRPATTLPAEGYTLEHDQAELAHAIHARVAAAVRQW
jgi:hypothetical protein